MRSRSKPRQLPTEQELYASALRALMRRAHSIHQMKEYLNGRSEDKDLVANVIARLRELNYLDDDYDPLTAAEAPIAPRASAI